MAQEIINIGASPNDGTGDPIRDAFSKVKNNFSEMYTSFIANGAITAGNSTVNTVISNTGGLVVSNSATSTVANLDIIKIGNTTANSTVNSTVISVFGNTTLGAASINTTAVTVGNSTTNATIAQGVVSVNAATVSSSLNATAFFLGNSTVSVSANSSRLTVNTANVLSNSFTLGSSSVGSSNFANGYTVLPNGLLYQWGYIAAVNSLANVTTFAAVGGVAFTNVFSVSATPTTNGVTVAVTAANSTTMTLLANSASGTGVYWNAIGK